MSRQEQKLKTRQSIIDAAFQLLNENRTLSAISLREVAREAGIAPTSFYRHFKDMDELGLTLVDEAGLALRQLMRQARRRIASGGGVIDTSVDTFMEFITASSNVFRLLLREHTGTSAAYRLAVSREIQHFTDELSDYIIEQLKIPHDIAVLQAEAMVRLVFSAGADALEADAILKAAISERVKKQLRFIQLGSLAFWQKWPD
ncbi:MAG: HTH-type transcriptional repressor FabR [Pseudomonadota bacterium]|uniref:DNA-binding transcriptional regulator, AcrR family n=1 Tax=Marisediminitalea aggregata TaxID=634436 RepID=A0A1M5S1M4_9ALTE|nr:HTH-type transcriptional repressor FabR [Marisediminitalea aggregata]MAP21797.1 HTH-type transcriptional repressor FabR [Alteromonadaceae bacterium]MCP4238214.1 HTH-type transcriptional repressor FabR [Aestuariibacter sp.]MEC7824580.1 HTH-type transcriptional repressor FabR [Pseudomonadota bacterium]BBO26229.1 DNA-binding transcriptional regulator FabR [Alteromonas sp. I4]HBY37987.1 HTH-type transcriptional repressor FabR [Alteromonas sp.]